MTRVYHRFSTLCAISLLTLVTLSLALPAAAQYQYPEECYDIRKETQIALVQGFPVASEVEVSRTLRDECVVPPDHRLNTDGASQAAIYCEDSGIAVWDIDSISRGTFAFLVPFEEIDRVGIDPGANVLLRENNGFRLYRLSSGEFQLNAPPDWEGKEYVFIWAGCERQPG